MKRFVNLVDDTASGIIGIVVAGLVVSGVLLYIAFGSKLDID
jgi:hypothetical protein